MRTKPAVEPCGDCPINSKCCTRGVEVSEEQFRLIETLPLPAPKPWFTTQVIDWNDGTGPNRSTTLTARGCVFLTEDFKCGIHRYCLEQGLEVKTYKPLDCQTYPYTGGELSDDYEILCGAYFGEPQPEAQSTTLQV